MKKIALIALFTMLASVSSYATDPKPLIDSHLLNASAFMADATHAKTKVKRMEAEREACSLIGYVYGTASAYGDITLKDGRSLLEVLNPALSYCSRIKFSNLGGDFKKMAEETSLDVAKKSLRDTYNNLY